MKVKVEKNNIIVSEVSCLDLDLTLDCGQAFRWERQEDGSYKGVAGGHFLHIAKDGDSLIFYDTNEAVFYSFWACLPQPLMSITASEFSIRTAGKHCVLSSSASRII